MNSKYLPIGSVVLLKNAKKRVMVIGYLSKSSTNNTYDYTACIYPIGIVDSKNLIFFNHDDIDIVFSYGYQNEDYDKLKKQLLEVNK